MVGSPRRQRILFVVVVAAVLAIGLVVGGRLTNRSGPDAVASTTLASPAVTPAAVAAGALALQNTFIHALQVATPSVVEISSTTSLGSGVVYDSRGDVVTNAHVVGTATTFSVLLSNGQRVSARLVGRFEPDDLAVIRLASAKGTKPAVFANSAKLQVGDLALAIGSPFGLSGSVTDGIVSSTGRTVSEPNGVLLPDTIQTSAAINPGNSGGALVDLAGQVIGIPTLAASQESGSEAPGIGFAIPSNRVKVIAPQLIANGKVTKAGRAALGITGTTVESATGEPGGVYVTSVTPNGPAAKAGILAGDIITALAGKKVETFNELQTLLSGLKPGAKVVVTVERAGATRNLTVVLGDLANS